MPPSADIVELLTRHADRQDPAWWSQGQPTSAARQELSWTCVLRLLNAALFHDHLPGELGLGHNGLRVPVDRATWSRIEAELGLSDAESRRTLVELAGTILRPSSRIPDTPRVLSPLLAGLVALMSGLSRQSRGAGTTPRTARLASPDPSLQPWFPPPPPDPVEALLEWAGTPPPHTPDRFRIVLQVLWHPLSRRSWSAPVIAPAREGPIELPRTLLRRSTEPTGPAEPALPSSPEPTREASSVPASGLAESSEAELAAALIALAEPLLALRQDPIVALDAEIQQLPPLAAEILRAWKRLLRAGELELYGDPGSTLELKLPDRAWRVDAGPFLGRDTTLPGSCRVVRRGIRFRGRVLHAASVIASRGR